MTFLIGGANSLTGGYEVSNSLKFRSANAAQMSQGNGTQTDADKWTVSFWIKLVAFADASRCVYSATGSSSTGSSITFVNNTLVVGCQGVSETDWVGTLGSSSILFRDPSAWYNICIGFDSTQGTAANRLRGYVNGVEHTFNTLTSPTQNEDSNFNNGSDSKIGGNITNNSHNLDAYISQFYFIDGTQKEASDFGETNDNGVWVPKKYAGAFGNNGTFVEGDSTTADASGNGNNYGQSNVVITTDTPTNNFATLNPLMAGRSSTLSEGNLKVTGESDNTYDVATFGSSMKWYMEWKVDENFDGSGGGIRIGAIHVDDVQVAFGSLGNTTAKYYTNSNDGKTQFGGGNNETTGLTRATTNDIIMCACDGAGAKIWWGINGTWLNYGSGAGDPAAGNNAAPWTNAMKAGIWFPATVYSGTAASGTLNLGNPPNAISSSQADDNGYGNFEYDVPAGFYSLCTKNLAEFG